MEEFHVESRNRIRHSRNELVWFWTCGRTMSSTSAWESCTASIIKFMWTWKESLSCRLWFIAFVVFKKNTGITFLLLRTKQSQCPHRVEEFDAVGLEGSGNLRSRYHGWYWETVAHRLAHGHDNSPESDLHFVSNANSTALPNDPVNQGFLKLLRTVFIYWICSLRIKRINVQGKSCEIRVGHGGPW